VADDPLAFAALFGDQPQILAAAMTVLLSFGQIVHDPFPDQTRRICGSRKPLFG
jgi:hypothetical protein